MTTATAQKIDLSGIRLSGRTAQIAKIIVDGGRGAEHYASGMVALTRTNDAFPAPVGTIAPILRGFESRGWLTSRRGENPNHGGRRVYYKLAPGVVGPLRKLLTQQGHY